MSANFAVVVVVVPLSRWIDVIVRFCASHVPADSVVVPFERNDHIRYVLLSWSYVMRVVIFNAVAPSVDER